MVVVVVASVVRFFMGDDGLCLCVFCGSIAVVGSLLNCCEHHTCLCVYCSLSGPPYPPAAFPSFISFPYQLQGFVVNLHLYVFVLFCFIYVYLFSGCVCVFR